MSIIRVGNINKYKITYRNDHAARHFFNNTEKKTTDSLAVESIYRTTRVTRPEFHIYM